MLENAGAQRVCYLTKKTSKFTLEIEGFTKGNKIEILHESPQKYELPDSIIYYVQRSKEMIILDNASRHTTNIESGKYIQDAYITQNQSKSILCMPVMSKGEAIGILYLENNLVEGAFNSQRVEILKVISSQLAISLENANP